VRFRVDINDKIAKIIRDNKATSCEFEDGGWCNNKKRCKDKCRVYKEGPRGGIRKTDSWSCMRAL
jgi:hypothetical protein